MFTSQISPFHFFGAPYEIGTHADTSQGIDSRNGPEKFRELFRELYGNYNIQTYIHDRGDLQARADVHSVLNTIRSSIATTLKSNDRFVIFGGAHTITLGTQRGIAEAVGDYSLIYFDAHPDIMPESEIHYGSVLHHAIEENILSPERLAFIGIRHIEREEEDFIERLGIKALTADIFGTCAWVDTFQRLRDSLPPPYFLSIDLDAVDPGMAPGVSTPYPFGLQPRELLKMAKAFCGPDLLGIEVVELSPKFDHDNQTARLAAGLVHELTKECFRS